MILGEQGIQGIPGLKGEGIPLGGTTGQILAKASNNDNDVEWIDNEGDSMLIGAIFMYASNTIPSKTFINIDNKSEEINFKK